MRSGRGDRRAFVLVLVIGLAGCLGERGGAPKQGVATVGLAKQIGAAKQTGAVVPVVPAVPAGGPGSCEATAAKLVELAVVEGKGMGREWTAEQQAQKREQFVTRCRDELPAGKVTRETLLCVEAATVMAQAKACLMAAAG